MSEFKVTKVDREAADERLDFLRIKEGSALSLAGWYYFLSSGQLWPVRTPENVIAKLAYGPPISTVRALEVMAFGDPVVITEEVKTPRQRLIEKFGEETVSDLEKLL